VLLEHAAELRVIKVRDGGSADPAADEVEQDIDPTEAGGDGRDDRPAIVSLAKVANGRQPEILS
jgi:hypothetical protein